ncbi:MAG: hypothetical protein RJQ14_03705 [Marinoscillum sp.]
MAKKVKIDLTYSKGKLWWSADNKTNWGLVGPNSPVTVVDIGTDIDWIADKTIDEVTITPKNAKVLDTPSGSKIDKKAKVKNGCKNGDMCKYDITIVLPNGDSVTLDPDIQVCDPSSQNCPPEGSNP